MINADILPSNHYKEFILGQLVPYIVVFDSIASYPRAQLVFIQQLQILASNLDIIILFSFIQSAFDQVVFLADFPSLTSDLGLMNQGGTRGQNIGIF